MAEGRRGRGRMERGTEEVKRANERVSGATREILDTQLIGAPTTPTFNRRRRRLIRMKQHGIPL